MDGLLSPSSKSPSPFNRWQLATLLQNLLLQLSPRAHMADQGMPSLPEADAHQPWLQTRVWSQSGGAPGLMGSMEQLCETQEPLALTDIMSSSFSLTMSNSFLMLAKSWRHLYSGRNEEEQSKGVLRRVPCHASLASSKRLAGNCMQQKLCQARTAFPGEARDSLVLVFFVAVPSHFYAEGLHLGCTNAAITEQKHKGLVAWFPGCRVHRGRTRGYP